MPLELGPPHVLLPSAWPANADIIFSGNVGGGGAQARRHVGGRAGQWNSHADSPQEITKSHPPTHIPSPTSSTLSVPPFLSLSPFPCYSRLNGVFQCRRRECRKRARHGRRNVVCGGHARSHPHTALGRPQRRTAVATAPCADASSGTRLPAGLDRLFTLCHPRRGPSTACCHCGQPACCVQVRLRLKPAT
jgi:hypothetical protein